MTDEPVAEEIRPERRQRLTALKRELVGGDLLTAAEVAEVLEIHPRTVGEYIRDGKLRAFQLGGGWKVSESALRAFVREQTQGPAGPAAGGAEGAQTVLRAIGDALMSLAPGSEGRAPAVKGGATYRCSFCGKDQGQVRRLIAGPRRVFICDACIALCNEIIAQETGTAGDSPPATS